MKLKWFGQSCFLLTSQAGTRVLMDPFDKKTGYKVPAVEADVVTTSHDHFDHNNIHAVKGNFYHIDQPRAYAHRDIQIARTLTYHDKVQGTRLGNNVVYCFTVDGIRVCHCGDLGHLLTLDQISRIGKVDVLLITICGFCAITPAEAVAIRKQLKPVITIPMHYRIREAGLFGLFYARVNQFLTATGESTHQLRELSVDSMNLAQHAGIVVLNYN